MTQVTEIQTIEAFGVPYVETRYQPEVEERQLITIEFEPPLHPLNDYGYSHPQFTFLEVVAIREQLEDCLKNKVDLAEHLELYEITAIQLTAPRTLEGRLTEAPHWCYGLRCPLETQELVWFSEEELISKWDIYGEWEEF